MSKKLYLITDCVGSSQLEILNESSEAGTGSIRFRGKFQEAEIQNKNKRIYRQAVLERERARLESVIEQRRLFGELDHPADSIIHLENASHLITKLWWQGNILMGEGEILNTPAGQILESIVRAGIPVGISSRGVGTGTTNGEGIMEIDDNYRMITFDMVADPSTNDAFVGQIGESTKQSHPTQNAKTTKPDGKNEPKNEDAGVDSTSKIVQPHLVTGLLKGIFEESYDSVKSKRS